MDAAMGYTANRGARRLSGRTWLILLGVVLVMVLGTLTVTAGEAKPTGPITDPQELLDFFGPVRDNLLVEIADVSRSSGTSVAGEQVMLQSLEEELGIIDGRIAETCAKTDGSHPLCAEVGA
jgi:hypothetical protein